VLLGAYELHLAAADATRTLAPPRKQAPPATAEQYEKLFADAERGLYAIDFFKTRFHEHIMRSLRTIIYRARPDGRELALLRAVFIEIVRTVDRVSRAKKEE
jgi:tRNA C32,U32 (ribose-2'-O)-methylase TrmJ